MRRATRCPPTGGEETRSEGGEAAVEMMTMAAAWPFASDRMREDGAIELALSPPSAVVDEEIVREPVRNWR